MVLYQIFLVIQLQQVFQPGVLKEHLSPSSSFFARVGVKWEKRFKQKYLEFVHIETRVT